MTAWGIVGLRTYDELKVLEQQVERKKAQLWLHVKSFSVEDAQAYDAHVAGERDFISELTGGVHRRRDGVVVKGVKEDGLES